MQPDVLNQNLMTSPSEETDKQPDLPTPRPYFHQALPT